MPESVTLLASVAIGAGAWLFNRAWEINAAKRVRYAEIASLISALSPAATPAARQRLLNEVAKLWIEASARVVRAAEAFLDALEAGDPAYEARLRELIILMRRDTFIITYFAPASRSTLEAHEIKLRLSARSQEHG